MRRRFLIVWTAAFLISVIVAYVTSEGEPVCRGPLITEVLTSYPPQCPDPIDGLWERTPGSRRSVS